MIVEKSFSNKFDYVYSVDGYHTLAYRETGEYPKSSLNYAVWVPFGKVLLRVMR